MLKVLLSIIFSFFILTINVCYSDNNCSDFDKYLYSLPKNSPESVINAKNKLLATISNKKVNTDEAFQKYLSFYLSVTKSLNKNELIIPKEKEKQLIEYYKSNGLSLWSSEGMYFISPSYDFLNTSFAQFLSPCWQKYLKFRIKEYKEGYYEDAGLIISWEKIRERISFIETFLKKYPTFPLKRVLENNLASYINSYILGANNSPITVSYDTKKISKEVKQSFIKFLKYNKNSGYYTL